jgi:hypothetical protein
LRSSEHRPSTQLIQVSATQHPAGTSRWVVVTFGSGAWGCECTARYITRPRCKAPPGHLLVSTERVVQRPSQSPEGLWGGTSPELGQPPHAAGGFVRGKRCPASLKPRETNFPENSLGFRAQCQHDKSAINERGRPIACPRGSGRRQHEHEDLGKSSPEAEGATEKVSTTSRRAIPGTLKLNRPELPSTPNRGAATKGWEWA